MSIAFSAVALYEGGLAPRSPKLSAHSHSGSEAGLLLPVCGGDEVTICHTPVHEVLALYHTIVTCAQDFKGCACSLEKAQYQ